MTVYFHSHIQPHLSHPLTIRLDEATKQLSHPPPLPQQFCWPEDRPTFRLSEPMVSLLSWRDQKAHKPISNSRLNHNSGSLFSYAVSVRFECRWSRIVSSFSCLLKSRVKIVYCFILHWFVTYFTLRHDNRKKNCFNAQWQSSQNIDAEWVHLNQSMQIRFSPAHHVRSALSGFGSPNWAPNGCRPDTPTVCFGSHALWILPAGYSDLLSW